MFYPTLSGIKNDFSNDLIKSLDLYFVNLTNNQKNNIDADSVSINLGIQYDVAEKLLDRCCEIKLLKKYPIIVCPFCDGKIKEIEFNNLFSVLENNQFCTHCDEEEFICTTDNVFIKYKIIKDPKKNINNIYKNRETEKKKKSFKKKSFSDKLISSPEDLHKLFYSPSAEEYRVLKELFNKRNNKFENTSKKGDIFNDLIIYLLKLCRCFKATKKIHTETNQLDCTVLNQISVNNSILSKQVIIPSVFNSIGDVFICECKNEEKKPSNTYFQKLDSMLGMDGLKFGIIFSKFSPPKTYTRLARDTYLSSKKFIITICEDDLKEIIEEKRNFFEIINEKIIKIKLGITTSGTELI